MPIIREKLSSSVVKEFQHLISTGVYKSGDKLPAQDVLASSMGVSRTALREALKQLNLMGLVEMKHGIGTYVSTLKPFALLKSLSPLMLMDQSTVDEFFEARLYIESIVAFLAAKKADSEDIKDLENLDRQMEQDLKQRKLADFVEKDLDFHLLIAKASKNRVLARVIQIIRDLVHDVVGDTFENDLEATKNILKQNRKIIKAIQSHDVEDARKCMEDHIMYVEKTIQKTKQS
jgi:GntR family transcriptional repressor for pyruvate dehydrogenase complex